jgi:competence protein ComGC
LQKVNMMMKIMAIISVLFVVPVPATYNQTIKKIPDEGEAELQRLLIINDLKALVVDSKNLLSPLAQAVAKAEIADAAWSLDVELAKQLLRDAYQLTFPPEDKQGKDNAQSTSMPPILLTGELRARFAARTRIIKIASRDKKFAEELQLLSEGRIPNYEKPYVYAKLAGDALESGDVEGASQFILKSYEADPTRGAISDVINDLAIQDRAAADRLILKYIESLKPVLLSHRNQSDGIVTLTFFSLMYPNDFFGDTNKPVPPPGPAVMRAYAGYVVESLQRMEQNEPGSIKYMRGLLMSAWLPLKQYAPELAGAFLELEKSSRMPGQDISLPTLDGEKAKRERYEKRLRDAAESDAPDDRTINLLIGNADFDKARRLIDKLPEGARRAQHAEKVNLKEALSLASKGDIAGASLLAQRLTKAASLLQLYPVLIKTCAGRNNTACVTRLGLQAMKQLEKADASPFAPPAGTPTSFFANGRESDLALQGLAKLTTSVAPFDVTLSFEVLDKMIAAANRSEVDTGQGRVGFDTEVFKTMAALDEVHARQAAGGMDDRLRRIASLAAISKWKAEMLNKASGSRMHKQAAK